MWGWSNRQDLAFFADLVPLGVVVYAAAVFMLEWVFRMVFWALAQREKDIEKRQAEGMARGLEKGRAEGRAEAQAEIRAEGQREAQERILLELAARGIQVPPGIISGDPVGRDAVLLENGDVYASQSLTAYIGRVNQEARAFMAQQGAPPEWPGLWCQRGWRVQLDRHFEELIITGRVQGLRLDASSGAWLVSAA